MTLRSAARRHFADVVVHAPYQPPPAVPVDNQGRADRRGTAWVLGCAAALALMFVLPRVGGIGLGSRALGSRVASVLETGVVNDLGAAVLDALVAGSAFPSR